VEPTQGLTARDLARCFARCYLVGATGNTRGGQNIGLAFAVEPGLRAIHREPQALKKAVKRYVGHFNSHPFWLPCLVGMFLATELRIKEGTFPAEMLNKVRNTTAYTLSAIGDSVFAGSLLVFWALATACLLLAGQRGLPLAFGLVLFAALQAFRCYSFVAGFRLGLRFLERLKHWDLIDMGQRVKCLNAVLVLWLWVQLWPRPVDWRVWLAGVAGFLTAGRLVHMRWLPREGVALLFLVACAIAPRIGEGFSALWQGLAGQ
jgi:PTS system mannose-specific IID component